MDKPGDGVTLFNDVHRWMAMQSEEMRDLIARHRKLTARRKEAIAVLDDTLTRDSAERKKTVNEFSLELEQYTLRKFDLLKEDVTAAHMHKTETENTALQQDDYSRKQRQITNL